MQPSASSLKSSGIDQRIDRLVALKKSNKPRLAVLKKEIIGNCQRCSLSSQRTNIVFGRGDSDSSLVVIGEAPGEVEDHQGVPFVGRSGKLLEQMLTEWMDPNDFYICNVVKCRPPQNRDPQPHEVRTCDPFLKAQLNIIKPKVLLAVGKYAAQTLLDTKTPISRLRGEFGEFNGIPLMPTFHPAYALRNQKAIVTMKGDISKVVAFLSKT